MPKYSWLRAPISSPLLARLARSRLGHARYPDPTSDIKQIGSEHVATGAKIRAVVAIQNAQGFAMQLAVSSNQTCEIDALAR